MNKTKFFSSLLVVALFATASVVTSCKDYDDDIKNLQSQIDGINKTLGQIQTLISSGSVITDVKTLTDGTGGVEIFLSNNKSYKIYNGAKGETGATGAQGEKGDKGDTGAAGADGVAPVVTIGDNGNWFINGVDTGKPSRGEKGEKGETGATGATGATGPQGPKGDAGVAGAKAVYYVPGTEGAEKGFWVKVDPNTDPETRTVTTEKWVGVDPNMVSAVMDKETGLLTLVNVQGATDTDENGNVNIALNNALRSLVFIGDIEDADGKVTRRYVGQVPTILVENFTYTALKLNNKDKTDNSKEEKAAFNQVNEEDEVLNVQPTTYAYYHVNPSTANVEDLKNLVFDINANGDYLTRADSKASKDFNVTPEFVEFKDGILVVKVLMEGTPATDNKISTVALQATKNNEETVTSDFVQIYKGTENPTFRIAKSLRGANDALVDWDFRRALVGIKTEDTDAGKGVTTGYVVKNKKVWDINYDQNNKPTNEGKDIDLCLNYKEEFNLNDSIELHDKSGTPHKYISLANALKKYNLEVSYEVVKNYKLGQQKTDQADFITLTGSVVKSKVYDDGTSEDPQLAAIGRTPIIRATLKDKTNDKIVEIAYIKIKWVKEANAVSGEHEIAMTKAFEFKCAEQSQSTTIQQTNIELYNQFGYDHATFKAVFTKFLPYNSEKLAANASDDDKKEAKDGYWAIHAKDNDNTVDKTYIDNVGTVQWVEAQGDQSETTYILKWTISADEMWQHGNGDIAHTVVFSNATGTNKIAVTLTSSITKVAKEYNVKPAADYIAQYWVNSTEYAKFNVSVPKSTSDANKENCKFENDLNSPFTTKNGILNVKDYRQLSSIKYFFDNDKNHGMQQITKMAGHDVVFKVSDDRLTLQARVKVGNSWKPSNDGFDDIAKITNSTTGNVKNVVELQNTTNAKILLNDQTAANPFYALYVAEGKVCEDASGTGADNTAREVEITFNGEDHFKASWTRPINVAAMSADNLIDGVDFTEYGSYIRIEDLIDPADWRDRKFSNFNNYWGFYGVENVLIDTNNAKANFGNGWVELPTNLVVGQDNMQGQTTVSGNKYYTNKPKLDDNGQIQRDNNNRIIYEEAKSVYGFFTYKNNGTTLLEDFQIQVTVKVTYKWGEITSAPIIVPVKNIGNVPTSAPQM